VSKIHAFGEFELDPLRFELRRRGQRVHLQPKVLRLLFHLVEQRERSVSSDELLQVLWPGEVVTLASVRRAVAGARRGLGENADCQSSIQTVRNHGYRFLLPVSELLVEAGNTESSNGHGEASAPDRVRSDRASISDADTTFVGRDQALAVLDGALSDSFAARSRHLWIRGEPGVGKTRVLEELAKRARAGGALVWLGRCMEVEGAPPLWPLIQILRAAAAQLGPRALLEAMGPGAGDIARAVPELRQWLPELPDSPSIDSLGARFRCFDSMALFLERVSERQLLVLRPFAC
jgi:DNA-binding winged helix-turn-helix (wHTH) protein